MAEGLGDAVGVGVGVGVGAGVGTGVGVGVAAGVGVGVGVGVGAGSCLDRKLPCECCVDPVPGRPRAAAVALAERAGHRHHVADRQCRGTERVGSDDGTHEAAAVVDVDAEPVRRTCRRYRSSRREP